MNDLTPEECLSEYIAAEYSHTGLGHRLQKIWRDAMAPAASRIARYLLALERTTNSGQQIADVCGVTRCYLSTKLAEWVRLGFVEHYGHGPYCVLNRKALMKIRDAE